MLEELLSLKAAALSELEKITELKEIEKWRVRYLGRKSRLKRILSELGELPPQQRPQIGAAANEVKRTLEEGLKQKEQTLKQREWQRLSRTAIDISLPGRNLFRGKLHPITQAIREISSIFQRMGFEVVEGPEVEWDYYNFQALNLPQGHPARDMFSTFWIDWLNERGERTMLLRTHTSPMQIRIMENRKPPIRVIVPGKVFRYEATDATHESMFHQIEGLAVDKNITMGDLKGTLYEFARILFGECRVRFRCTYFPFVEPGVDMATDCFLCGGRGCRVCSYSGWLEILGAGMVHPEVLSRVNYDPRVYSGFAFGLGVERIWMLKYGINDIRLFYQNDLRFLSQL